MNRIKDKVNSKCQSSPLYGGREEPGVSRFIGTFFLITIIFFLTINSAFSWGFFAHKQINKLAVFTLPPEMVGFYKKNIEYITVHAVDADKRRRLNNYEAARHYIDADYYGSHPFDSIPKEWKKAIEKYSEDTLKAYGILPWHIDLMLYKLTEAFKASNKKDILYLSANISHYIADAHVPLHTTINYNGQLTNQQGIHGLWESKVPELKSDSFDLLTGRAQYIKKPLDAVWKTIQQSFNAKDSVLLFEAELSKKFPTDQKHSYEQKGRKTNRTYSKEYVEAYNKLMNGMVERRMRESIRLLGSLWYTAWINAGQPDLSKLNEQVNKEDKNDSTETPAINPLLKGHEE